MSNTGGSENSTPVPPPPPPPPGPAGSGGSGAPRKQGSSARLRVEMKRCAVCGKEFGSVKALFGHMNSHPNRGWRGVYPPPVFNREEEFADLQPQAEVAVPPERRNVLPDLNETEPAVEQYQLPDLNLPPPEEE